MKKLGTFLLAFLLCALPVAATNLTGTITAPDGSHPTGGLWLELNQAANLNGGACGGPTSLSPGIPTVFNLTNGSISGPGGGPYTVFGNDCITPTTTYYRMTVITTAGATALRKNVSITGSSVDIGTLPGPGGGGGGGTTLGGDAIGAIGANTVIRFQNRPFAATAPGDLNTICWDAAGTTWKPCTGGGGGGGTVTNVGNSTIGPLFSASWANPTTTPALSLDLAAQSSNCVIASPAGGGSGVPACRSLVLADIGNGLVTYAKMQNVSASPRLLGRTTAGAGVIEELSAGNGIALSGGTAALGPLTADWNGGNFNITSRNSLSLYNVVAYGADPTGVSDSSTAIATAMTASGGNIYFPDGVFLTGEITLPCVAYITMHVLGAGMHRTTLVSKTANTQLFAATAACGEVTKVEIGHLSVKAHASGSTGAAFNLERFHSSYIHDIEFLSNGAGNWIDGFLLHAPSGASCYNNRISNIRVWYQSGPSKVLHCNAGGVQAESPNINFADHWNVEGNTGISRVFDAGDSLAFHVSDCLVEGNTGAVVLVPGALTTFERNYLEANAANPILPEAGHVWSPQSVTLRDNYFHGTITITLTSASSGWQIVNNIPVPTLVDSGTFNNEQLGNNFQHGVVVNGAVVATGAPLPALYPSAAAMDWLSGVARFFSMGADDATLGRYDFRQVSSAGALSGTPLSIGATGLVTVEADSAAAIPEQLIIHGKTDTNRQLILGYRTSGNYGSIQAVNQVVDYMPLALNPSGGGVGVNNTDAKTALDVKGAVSTREFALTVANGLNSNIALTAASWFRLAGATGAFSLGGFTSPFDGREAVFYNPMAQTMTIVNEDGSSTATNRIKTLTGADVVLAATATSAAWFRYNLTDGRWILLGVWNMPTAGSGTVTNIATTSPITGGPITTTGTIACATCVTSAAALTNGQLVAGAGGQASVVTNLSGEVTTSGGVATTIATAAVTYAKMQNVSAASKLLGRGDSGAGVPQEISLGGGLTMTGTTLAAAAAGVTSVACGNGLSCSPSPIVATGTVSLAPNIAPGTGNYSGSAEVGTCGETLAFKDVAYFKGADSRWWKAKADAEGTAGSVQVGIVVVGGAAAAACTVLVDGYLESTGWGLTVGGPGYISEATGGLLTQTRPSTSTNIIRVLGWAKSATAFYLRPAGDWVQY